MKFFIGVFAVILVAIILLSANHFLKKVNEGTQWQAAASSSFGEGIGDSIGMFLGTLQFIADIIVGFLIFILNLLTGKVAG